MNIYKTTEVAARLRISKQTLVRYEKKGIFPRPRRNRINSWREYTDEDVKKMEHILGRGVTLIELTMVMVMISILLVLAVPRFQSFYFIKLNGAVKKVAADIRYVQQLSISRHESYKIVFDPVFNKYEVRRVSDNSLAVNPFSRNSFVVNFNSDPQYKGIDVASANFGGTAGVRFDWQGVPQNDSGVNLLSEGEVRFTYQGNAFSVFVGPNTGWVRAQ